MQFPRLALALASTICVSNFSVNAELKTAAIFGDNMVLQQQMPVPVWGWAAPGADVTVRFSGQTKSTRASADGKWLVKLGKLNATSAPQTLVIASGETKTFTNILVGEVWLASGQSNMEKPLGKRTGQRPTFNAEAELAAANYPNLRIFQVEKILSAAPLDDLQKFQGWQPCNSNALDSISFSAAAYFFGREIHTNLNVPVGLVESAWGGTRIEPWTPPVGFAQVASQKKFSETKLSTNKLSNTRPTAIYNAMIAPIAGFAMRGALWYQGESNLMGTNVDNDYLEYADKMAALVGGWRTIWGEGVFPFYFVQIAPFKYYGAKTRRVNSAEQLAEFWTLQSRAARKIKNTGMVVTTDLVDDLNDIHPRNKTDVGHRLALLALNRTYGKKVVSSGPTFKSMEIDGNIAILRFNHVDGGLINKDKLPMKWFSIAGADGKFVPAIAKIVMPADEVFSSSPNWNKVSVCVSSPDVKDPKAVRFAWDETAQPDLFNAAGLPAEPFRTDDPWK